MPLRATPYHITLRYDAMPYAATAYTPLFCRHTPRTLFDDACYAMPMLLLLLLRYYFDIR